MKKYNNSIQPSRVIVKKNSKIKFINFGFYNSSNIY